MRSSHQATARPPIGTGATSSLRCATSPQSTPSLSSPSPGDFTFDSLYTGDTPSRHHHHHFSHHSHNHSHHRHSHSTASPAAASRASAMRHHRCPSALRTAGNNGAYDDGDDDAMFAAPGAEPIPHGPPQERYLQHERARSRSRRRRAFGRTPLAVCDGWWARNDVSLEHAEFRRGVRTVPHKTPSTAPSFAKYSPPDTPLDRVIVV